MAKEFEIVKEASAIAKEAWNKWEQVKSMVATPEARISAEEAIEAVTAYPHVGEVEEGIYIGKQRADNGGQVVELTAVWQGAARLAGGDTTIIGIILLKNPNHRDLQNAVSLTIYRHGDDPVEVVYRPGETPQLDSNRARLVNIVLENIVTRLA